jgi:hypothetical protein
VKMISVKEPLGITVSSPVPDPKSHFYNEMGTSSVM